MIKNIVRILLIAGWYSCALQPLYAQQDLARLWLEVQEQYPGLQQRQAHIEADRLRAQAVKSDALPQAKAQAQNNYGTHQTSQGSFFPQAGFFNVNSPAATTGASYMSSTFASTILEYELFTFGRQQAAQEAANMRTSQSEAEKEAYALQLKKELTSRYVYYRYTESKRNWVQQHSQRLEELHRIAAGLSKAGLKPAADSLLAYAAYEQALANKDLWTGNKALAIARLQEIYGPKDLSLSRDNKLFDDRNLQAEGMTTENIDEHPLLTVFSKAATYHQLVAKEQKKASRPSIKLMAGYAFRGSGISPQGNVSGSWVDGFSNHANNGLVGIGLTWNVTSSYSNKLRSQAWKQESEKSRLQQVENRQAIHANLQGVKRKLQEQGKQIGRTQLALQHSQDAYVMYKARYKSGLLSMTELLQTSLLLEQAENNHIEALHSYWQQKTEEAWLSHDFDFLFNNL